MRVHLSIDEADAKKLRRLARLTAEQYPDESRAGELAQLVANLIPDPSVIVDWTPEEVLAREG